MSEMPNPQILLTYRLATFFKLIGVMTGITTGYITIWEWIPPFFRWWSAGLGALVLLLSLLPWWKWFPEDNQPKIAHRFLILSLIIGIVTPNLELLHATIQPYEDLFAYPQFVEILKFTPDQVNNIHGFGQMFMIVPLILAAWQYRLKGILWGLPLAGLSFVIVAFFMPVDAFNWYFYAIRGFVLLGISLIVALITWMLVETTRSEQEKLALANRKLAEQALVMEEFAASRERNRLARELHDTLAHSISGATVQLQAVKTLLKVDPEAAGQELVVAQQQLKHGLAESRRAISTLRASSLEELGLAGALKKEAEKISQRSGISLEANLADLGPLDPTREQAIFRIITSAMNNIERHSEATKMKIKLIHDHGRPALLVDDNGVGFDASVGSPDGRYGLVGMHERAELIGTDLQVNSRLGEGCSVILFLPQSQFDTV
ncbi:MAG: sensor histidine kinase [Anaerolineae bacterium]